MSLAPEWVDMIFDKLGLVYGQEFLRRWVDIDLEKVKADWAHELDGYDQHPKAIAWALQNLPEGKPPTVLQFRAICRRAPPRSLQRLDHAPPSPEFINRALRRFGPRIRPSGTPSRAWADKLIARHEAGERVSKVALAAAREVVAKRPIPFPQIDVDEEGVQP